MRLLAILMLSVAAFAQDKPDETSLLRAEIESLKARLANVTQQLQIALSPEVMRVRLADADAAARLEAGQKAAAPKAKN